jgi:predicted nucleic acid-binding protein
MIKPTIELEVADFRLESNRHFLDALVYATADHWKVMFYTSDSDLRELKSVCVI